MYGGLAIYLSKVNQKSNLTQIKREGSIKVSFFFAKFTVTIMKGGDVMTYFSTYLLIGLLFATIMFIVATAARMLGRVRSGHSFHAIAPVRYVTYVAFWPIWVVLLIFDEIVA